MYRVLQISVFTHYEAKSYSKQKNNVHGSCLAMYWMPDHILEGGFMFFFFFFNFWGIFNHKCFLSCDNIDMIRSEP